MKIFLRSVVVLSILLVAPTAFAVQIITDEGLFNSLYSNPTQSIDFGHLIDGSTVLNADTSPLVTSYSRGENSYSFSVRQNGWSNAVWIGSSSLNCNCAWTATNWNGSAISPETYSSIYLDFAMDRAATATPFSINSGAGFVGYVPSSPSETYFLLNGVASISSLRFGYAVSPVPEPETYALMLLGLGLISIVGRNKTMQS